jgi:hypothetical protein
MKNKTKENRPILTYWLCSFVESLKIKPATVKIGNAS